MSDEIKRILKEIEFFDENYVLDKKDSKLLLDYITNLQQELKNKNEGIKAFCEDLRETAEQVGELEFKNKQLQQTLNTYSQNNSNQNSMDNWNYMNNMMKMIQQQSPIQWGYNQNNNNNSNIYAYHFNNNYRGFGSNGNNTNQNY